MRSIWHRVEPDTASGRSWIDALPTAFLGLAETRNLLLEDGRTVYNSTTAKTEVTFGCNGDRTKARRNHGHEPSQC